MFRSLLLSCIDVFFRFSFSSLCQRLAKPRHFCHMPLNVSTRGTKFTDAHAVMFCLQDRKGVADIFHRLCVPRTRVYMFWTEIVVSGLGFMILISRCVTPDWNPAYQAITFRLDVWCGFGWNIVLKRSRSCCTPVVCKLRYVRYDIVPQTVLLYRCPMAVREKSCRTFA